MRVHSRVRERHKIANIILIFFLAFSVLFGLNYFLRNDEFLIKGVVVQGVQGSISGDVHDFVERELAGSYLALFSKKNIFLLSESSLNKSLLQKFPNFRGIITEEKFRSLTIRVDEFEKDTVICLVGSSFCTFVNENGVGFGQIEVEQANRYIIISSIRKLSDEKIKKLLSIIRTFEELGYPIGESVIMSNSDVRLITRVGWGFLYSDNEDYELTVNKFKTTMNSDIFKGKNLGSLEYLDLRFGDKIYYKFK
ncbi:MAG TPA: hypothetical protein VJK09_01690 [Candidatus Paceibacterota bacterium]